MIVKLLMSRFTLEYPKHNAQLIKDIEHHEDRWAGEIISEVQAIAAKMYVLDSETEQRRYFLPFVGVVCVESDLIYYDSPLLYVVRDERHRRFVGYSAHSTKTHTVYWYAKVDDCTYTNVTNGEQDIRAFFHDSSNVIEVRVRSATGNITAAYKTYGYKLKDTYLPSAGTRFKPIAESILTPPSQ